MTKCYLALSLVVLMFIACNSPKEKEVLKKEVAKAETNSTVDLVKRGENLVASVGCNDCHSPKIMTDKGPEVDPERRLSGHPSYEKLAPYDKETAKSYVLFTMGLTAAVGPWGTSFAANLTPDETGIGNWSESQFLKAIKEGKFKGMDGTRPLLPPMPWTEYRHFPDEDLKAIFAYLKTVKPVDNVVPAPIPPSPQLLGAK
ncbi:diheme cytochrome c-553 [Arenibacter sp. N53]|uniref:c-type cytochrome n=1 Tax=Arenibacter TaxID=178469 RepID=UPI000CD40565|nr:MULTISPECIES: c-type cytochrome [Arenibacter]MCM4150998.1 diheme cytochrome c-553 [Arenibacter sp. N53]